MRRSAAVLVLASALLAGCSDSSDTAPGSLPPATGSTEAGLSSPAAAPAAREPNEPSPRASLPPVVRPPEADEPTAEGAAAFARYWYAELDRAYDLLDSRRIQALSHRQCQVCQRYIEDIDLAAREGEVYRGGGFQVLSAVAPALQNTSTVVLLRYSSPPLVVSDRDGHVVSRSAHRSSVTSQLLVSRQGEGWRVREAREMS